MEEYFLWDLVCFKNVSSQTMNYTEKEKFPKVERRLKQGTNGQTTAASPTLQYYRPMVTERN